MELRDYLAIIGRRLGLFLVVIVIVTAAFIGYGTTLKPSFTGLATITVIKKADQTTQAADYRFDNFYTLQTNEGLAKQVAGWLADPTVIQAIYDSANVAHPAQSITRYDKALKSKPLGAGVVEITTTAGTAHDAENIATESVKAIQSRLAALVEHGTLGAMDVSVSKALSEENKMGLTTLAVAGLIVGLILGLILVFFVEYLAPSTKRTK